MMKRESQQSHRAGLKSIQSLEAFKLLPTEVAPVYHNADTLPPFLLNNLKSEHRVVKQFSGENAIIRAFYFNLMKLSFEIESETHNYAEITKKILTSEDQFSMGELEDKNFTDKQYRQFMLRFIQILENQDVPNFEQTIKWYPVIDDILLKMFKMMVPVTLLIKDTTDFNITKRILEFLSNKFKIKVQVISGCFKFIESDIFLYLSSLKLTYIIFLDQLAFIKEVTEYPSSEAMNQSNRRFNESYFSNKSVLRAEGKSVCTSSEQCSGNAPVESGRREKLKTAINMLDSKKSISQRSDFSNSIKLRSSFEGFINKQTPNNILEDKVTENDITPAQEYYGSSQKQSLKSFSSSISSVKPIQLIVFQEKKEIQLHPQPTPAPKTNRDLKASSITSKSNSRENSGVESYFNSSSNAAQKPQEVKEDSKVKENIPTQKLLEKKPSISSSSKSNSKESSVFEYSYFNSSSIAAQKSPSELKQDSRIKESVTEQKNPHRFTGLVRKPTQELSTKTTSQILSKNENLSLFSKLDGKQNIKREEKAKQASDESESNIFTDSGLLQMLDDKYKNQIKSIKQKYRQQRTKIRSFI